MKRMWVIVGTSLLLAIGTLAQPPAHRLSVFSDFGDMDVQTLKQNMLTNMTQQRNIPVSIPPEPGTFNRVPRTIGPQPEPPEISQNPLDPFTPPQGDSLLLWDRDDNPPGTWDYRGGVPPAQR